MRMCFHNCEYDHFAGGENLYTFYA